MKLIKKVLAAALMGVMVLSMASCGGQSWVVKDGDKEMPVGVYTYYVYNLYQMYSNYGAIDVNTSVNKQTIPDTNEAGEQIEVPADEYINDYALDQTLYLFELTKRFEDAGLTISDEEMAELEEAVSEEYLTGRDFFETNGVAKSSVVYGSTSGRYGVMQRKLYEYTYGKGGPKEVTDEALLDYYNNNYVSYTYIYEQTTDSNGQPVDDEKKNSIKASFESIKAGMADGSADLEAIAKQYQEAYAADYTCGKNGTPMVTNQKADSELMTQLLNMANDEVKIIELDGYIFLMQRHDISKNGYFEENRTEIFDNMNYPGFQSEIQDAAKEAGYETNSSALKKFGIRKLKIDGATL